MPALAPSSHLVGDHVRWWAEQTPDREALVLGELRWTYGELQAQIERLADAMIASGLKPGDRVATLQTPHPIFVVVFLATALAGGIWVGLNPRYQVDELLHVVEDCSPRLLFSRSLIGGRSYADELGALAERSGADTVIFEGDPRVAGALTMGEFLARGAGSAARPRVDRRDACLIVYTSGSTGKPKGAVLSQEGLASFARAQNELWPVEDLRSINYFPINHVGCVVDCTLPTLAAGGAIVFMEKFDARECLRLMEVERISFWGSVPSVFQMMLAEPDFGRFDLSAVRLIVWEGAAAPEGLIKRLLEVCPRLATNYGMTETTSAVTALAPTSDVEVLAGSVGEAFPGVEVRLVGPDGAESPAGEPGEVQARSIQNLLGYWGRPQDTDQAFTADGFFKTGDLAIRRSDGRYRIVGRLKEMFKSGGYNVYPREIEDVLEAHPAVAMAAVVARPDPLWQEIGVAFVSLKDPLGVGELEAHCRARLANYKQPKIFVIENDLPLLPIGKVDKRALAVRAAALD